jgi:hypothetical protein
VDVDDLGVSTVCHQAFHHLGVSLRSRLHERGIPEPRSLLVWLCLTSEKDLHTIEMASATCLEKRGSTTGVALVHRRLRLEQEAQDLTVSVQGSQTQWREVRRLPCIRGDVLQAPRNLFNIVRSH